MSEETTFARRIILDRIESTLPQYEPTVFTASLDDPEVKYTGSKVVAEWTPGHRPCLAGDNMSNQKDDALATVGKLLNINEEYQRDAIHIAVISALAGEILQPGSRVSLDNGIASLATVDESLGIVDPFLKEQVFMGEKFWIFLNPRSTTSLRHVWEHPGIPSETSDPGFVPDSYARDRLTKFADELNITYEELIDGATNYVKNGEYFCGGDFFEGAGVPSRFWRDFEKVTGISCDNIDDNEYFLRCSC